MAVLQALVQAMTSTATPSAHLCTAGIEMPDLPSATEQQLYFGADSLG